MLNSKISNVLGVCQSGSQSSVRRSYFPPQSFDMCLFINKYFFFKSIDFALALCQTLFCHSVEHDRAVPSWILKVSGLRINKTITLQGQGCTSHPEPEFLYCFLNQSTVTPQPLPTHHHYSEVAKGELSKTTPQRKHCILNYDQHMLNVLCLLTRQLHVEHNKMLPNAKLRGFFCYFREGRVRHRSMKKCELSFHHRLNIIQHSKIAF